MADERLYNPATRWYLAHPLAFADWKTPTIAELNANPTNDPHGLIFNLTCAVDQADSQFDLGASETNDSLTFCQVAGAENPTNFNPEVVYSIVRSKERWIFSDDSTRNTSNLAFSLLAWRGVEYFAILSVGKEPDAVFAAGDRLKMVRVATDFAPDSYGSGEETKLTSNLRNRSDVNWNYEIQA